MASTKRGNLVRANDLPFFSSHLPTYTPNKWKEAEKRLISSFRGKGEIFSSLLIVIICRKKLNIDTKLGKWERIKRKTTYLPLTLFRGSVAIVTNVAKVLEILTVNTLSAENSGSNLLWRKTSIFLIVQDRPWMEIMHKHTEISKSSKNWGWLIVVSDKILCLNVGVHLSWEQVVAEILNWGCQNTFSNLFTKVPITYWGHLLVIQLSLV